ncbi:MAG TPA: T9SS type A sorting domain-containing protein, partial [Bacteroidetes bacterium]|nr:T9SS type A sorting domain-containing protein [Bacteroidota bacterium]
PVVDTITVQEQEIMIDMVDVEMEDEDGLFGNGEVVPTRLLLRNSGDAAAEDVTVYLSSENPWISFDDDTVAVGDMAAGQERLMEFDLHINQSSKPALTRIDVRITAGGDEWQHSFQFTTAGSMFMVRRVLLNDGDFERGERVALVPELTNNGLLPSVGVSASLVCLNERYQNAVDIITDEVAYPVIPAGQYAVPSGNGAFTIELDSTIIPGDTARFNLELFAELGDEDFRDTVYFEYPIGEPDVQDPFGPDEYGYICFDSGDESWDKAPEYDWIEINPSEEDFDFEGTRLLMEDYQEDDDTSAVVELPFTFQYYGEQFDTLIVCTNGWVAFGNDNSWYHLFRNWPIPGIQGPDAQIAVLWQDLRITGVLDDRGVYYYHDADRAIFIVEWSNMQIRNDIGPEEHLVEFQLILYDPSEHFTSTGDGEIKMQYRRFDEYGGAGTDNQYSTIGLKNLDNTGGLMYQYGNHYTDDRCMHLENETALLFSVDVKTAYGALAGRVVDAGDTNQVLTGVEVMLSRSALTVHTDDEGRFEIDSVAVGREVVFSSLNMFNTMIDTVFISEAETTRVDIYMTYPLFRCEEEGIEAEARPGYAVGGDLIHIFNDGIGPLDYSVQRRYRDGSEPGYEHVQSLRIDEEAETDYIYGCQFVGDSIYVCYTHDRNTPGNAYIGVFDRNGRQVRRFLQPCDRANGFWDMAWDGEYLCGGDFRDGDTTQVIVRLDLEGNFVDDITVRIPGDEWGDIAFPMALAYDPESGYFFVASNYSKIYKCDLSGRIVDQFFVNLPGGVRPHVTGMAWNATDNEAMPLYLMDWVSGEDDRRMRLVKVDPTTHRARIAGDISQSIRDRGKSLTVGFDWDQGVANMAAIADAGDRNDSLRIYEIGPDTRFLKVNNPAGRISAGNGTSLNLIMSAEYYDEERTLEMGLEINHNARGDAGFVPITFHVDPSSDIEETPSLPMVFGLEHAYPNPFNAETRIGFTIERTAPARLAVYDVSGRLVAVLVDGEITAGRHMVSFNADKLASGIYFYRIDSGDMFDVKRMVLLR